MKQYQKYTIYIFYILVFLVIFLSNLSPKILYEENIKQNDIIVCITSLFCIFLLYILMLLYKKSKEDFNYELTSEKNCCSYKNNEECQKLSKKNYKLSEKNMSNAYWENDFYDYENDYGIEDNIIDDNVLEDNILEDNILKIIY